QKRPGEHLQVQAGDREEVGGAGASEGVVDFWVDAFTTPEQERGGERSRIRIEAANKSGVAPGADSAQQQEARRRAAARVIPDAFRAIDRKAEPDSVRAQKCAIIELAGIQRTRNGGKPSGDLDGPAGLEVGTVSRDRYERTT